jgi:hypothetical protein
VGRYIEVALQGRRSSCSSCGRIVLNVAMRRASNFHPLIAAAYRPHFALNFCRSWKKRRRAKSVRRLDNFILSRAR